METGHKAILLALVALLLLPAGFAVAEIYKSVDKDGHVQFTDKPPRDTVSESVKLRRINTIRSVSVSELPGGAAGGKTVTIYTATWCGICDTAKQYFRQQAIPYKEYDVETSSKGKNDFRKLKGTGVPIILIGNKRMNGFTVQRFESLYGGLSRVDSPFWRVIGCTPITRQTTSDIPRSLLFPGPPWG